MHFLRHTGRQTPNSSEFSHFQRFLESVLCDWSEATLTGPLSPQGKGGGVILKNQVSITSDTPEAQKAEGLPWLQGLGHQRGALSGEWGLAQGLVEQQAQEDGQQDEGQAGHEDDEPQLVVEL
ncbi:hypothetical protein JZ751_010471 [Albula glossodonta]|uniref:Uncharacterized protein n=1 Tax=Albula glossodonta TaxID=121402 RepID=A0A8T2NXB2_9TELE|nr:hypothetical protein JZ751_010471 [Albula glossodonta]